MKSSIKRLLICMMLIVSFSFISACNSDNDEVNDTIPTFESFEIKSESSKNLLSSDNNASVSLLSNDDKPFGETKKTIEEKINEEIDLGEQISFSYAVQKNEYVYAITKINNPSSKAISSITINGYRYTSNMFENNSTREEIIVMINVGNEEGIKSYTLEKIRYIEGSNTKEVEITGNVNRIIKIGNLSNLIHQEKDLIITSTNISFTFEITDYSSAISKTNGKVSAILYDGENTVIKNIQIGTQIVDFDDLEANKKYQYAVVATYDKLDGNGKQNYILRKNTITTNDSKIPEYTITKANIINGTITVVSKAIEGTILPIIVTPDEGYMLEKLYYVGSNSSVKHNISNRQFEMPNMNITIYATFKEKNIENEDVSSKFLQGYITNDNTILETEHFTFEIDANVYVPGYLEEYIEVIYDALERVSRLKFYNEHYNPAKIVIEVEKIKSEKNPDAEVAGAYAYSKEARIHISSGDLLLGNSYAISHELSHILMYSQSSWSYSQVFTEGFAQYNSYKATQYLEEYNYNVAKSLEDAKANLGDMSIHGNIYSKTIKYWIENTKEAYEISGNGAYSIGFRFMSYLDNKYSNYSNWIKYYEKINPYYTNKNVNQQVNLQIQYAAMEQTYGVNVFDGFYPWLRINESILFKDPWQEENSLYDMAAMEYTYIYPYFYAGGHSTHMTKYYKFKYYNLYVGIDEARNYLKHYKKKNVNNLKLKLEKEVEVELYDSNNNLIDSKVDDEFSLVGVSYIKLVGEGTLGKSYTHGLEIVY